MTTLKILTMLTMLSFGFTSRNTKLSETETDANGLMTLTSDSSTVKTLTITKVKKPWYAFHTIVIGKMRKSIPEYQAIKGLNEKFYCLTEDHKRFGGLYFWETKQDANNWFSQAWFEQTEKKFGEKGIVEYYKVLDEKTISTLNPNSKNLYAAFTLVKEDTLLIENSADGLIKIIKLADEKNQTYFLTIWQNKDRAKSYMHKKNTNSEFFDIPFYIVGKK